MKSLELLPAIDIKSGRVSQAITLTASEFSGTPQQVLDSFIAAGASWIHLVDLDAAYSTGSNFDLLSNLAKSSNANVQASGGISNKTIFSSFLKTASKWINLSTAALIDLNWIRSVLEEHSGRVCISLDILDGVLIARGSGVEIGNLSKYINLLNRAGCKRYVVTDNKTEGKMSGPNFDLLLKIQEQTNACLIASGGVSNLSDLSKLREIGIDGVIVGKALYEGEINFSAALNTCYK